VNIREQSGSLVIICDYMPNTEHRALEIIFDCGGEAPVFTIGRELGFSTDYARMICESLGRRDYIDYWASRGLCILKNKGTEIGKKEAAQRKNLKKVIPGRSSLNKKGKLVLGY